MKQCICILMQISTATCISCLPGWAELGDVQLKTCSVSLYEWVSRGLTSHSTLYRSLRGQFLHTRWPNQQRQSTEGSQMKLWRLRQVMAKFSDTEALFPVKKLRQPKNRGWCTKTATRDWQKFLASTQNCLPRLSRQKLATVTKLLVV